MFSSLAATAMLLAKLRYMWEHENMKYWYDVFLKIMKLMLCVL